MEGPPSASPPQVARWTRCPPGPRAIRSRCRAPSVSGCRVSPYRVYVRCRDEKLAPEEDAMKYLLQIYPAARRVRPAVRGRAVHGHPRHLDLGHCLYRWPCPSIQRPPSARELSVASHRRSRGGPSAASSCSAPDSPALDIAARIPAAGWAAPWRCGRWWRGRGCSSRSSATGAGSSSSSGCFALRPLARRTSASRRGRSWRLGAAANPALALDPDHNVHRGARRNVALGAWGAVGGFGAAAGVLMANRPSPWEWVFFVNFPSAFSAHRRSL